MMAHQTSAEIYICLTRDDKKLRVHCHYYTVDGLPHADFYEAKAVKITARVQQYWGTRDFVGASECLLKSFIDSLSLNISTEFDPQCVEKSLKDLKIIKHISNALARVLHHASYFFERLEKISYGYFFSSNRNNTIKLMCNNILLLRLRKVMITRIECDEVLKSNVNWFVKNLPK